jgi:hypothetical protein
MAADPGKRKKGKDKKVKPYKRGKNVPAAPKSKKRRSKTGTTTSLPHSSSTSQSRKDKMKTDASPTKYSPEGEWIIMHGGDSRRNPKNPNRNEDKPYHGWSKDKKKVKKK